MALPLFKAEEAYLFVSSSPSLFSHSGSQLSCSLILSEILLRSHGNQDKKSGPSLLLLQEPDLWEVSVSPWLCLPGPCLPLSAYVLEWVCLHLPLPL